MSLDIDLIAVKPCSVFDWNCTHNLGEMAREVKLTNGLTLYQVMWRPDEVGHTYAKDISELLDEGWNILMSDPEHFKKFNPSNNWGDYDGLLSFAYEYRNACWKYPDAKISVSR